MNSESLYRVIYRGGHCILAILSLVSFHLSGHPGDSLCLVAKRATNDSLKARAYIDAAWEWKEDKPILADSLLHISEQICLKKNLWNTLAETYSVLGTVASIQQQNTISLKYYQQSLNWRVKLRDLLGQAKCYNNIGNTYESSGKYVDALSAYQSASRIYTQLHDTMRLARTTYNMGIVQEAMGHYPEAQDLVLKYLALAEHMEDTEGMAAAWNMLGNIKVELKRGGESLQHYRKAQALYNGLEDSSHIAHILLNIGNVYSDLATDSIEQPTYLFWSDTAEQYLNSSLQISKSLEDVGLQATGLNNLAILLKDRGGWYQRNNQKSKAINLWNKAIQLTEQAEEIRTRLDDTPGLIEVYNVKGDLLRRLGKQDDAFRYIQKYEALALEIGDTKHIQRALDDYAKHYAAIGDYEKAYAYHVRFEKYKYERINEKLITDFERREALFGDVRKQYTIEKQQSEIALQESEIRRSTIFRNALLGGAAGLLLIAFLLWNRNRLKAAANRMLTEKNAIIESERQRSDALLKNILPTQTAEELKNTGTSEARYYQEVTVLFSDFSGFTEHAAFLTPAELVRELDYCFREFDAITSKYGLEKIKTIGDAYLCAGGVPAELPDHALHVVQAAREMQQFISTYRQEKLKLYDSFWSMRIGIHSGPVVAGIVGSHKFAYDIWGDTVNIASRMESASAPGQINISQSTYQLVKHQMHCSYRGMIPVKGKGELAMYFVEV